MLQILIFLHRRENFQFCFKRNLDKKNEKLSNFTCMFGRLPRWKTVSIIKKKLTYGN